MKKMLATVLVVGMLVSLAGCANTSDKTKSESASDKPTSETSAEPAKTEKVTFSATFLQNEWHGDPNDMEILTKLEEKANVDVKWDVYASATWPDKKNLMIAGGTLPDVFYMNTVNNDDINKYALQGMFMDLTKLIDQYAPALKKNLEEMPQFKAICVNPDDGKIYSVGRAAEREVQYYGGLMYINNVWLKQLGMEVPKTTDEFYNVLKAFKTQDPNGNKHNDEIPFSFHMNTNKIDEGYLYDSLFGAFGYVDALSGAQHFIKDDKGEIVYVAKQPEYRDAISFYGKCVQEGLWDAEGFTTPDTSVLNAKGNSETPILGSFVSYDSSFVLPTNRYEDYVVVPPLKGPKGDQVWLRNGASNGNVNGTQFVMTAEAKGKEEGIMRWLDAHFDPEISAQLFLGVEGKTLQKDASGMLDYIPTPEGMSYSEFRYGQSPVHVPCVIKSADWGKVVQVMDEDINKLSAGEESYKKYMTQSSIFLLPNKEESKYMLKEAKDINDYVNKMQVKWMTEGGIETEWEAYLAELQKLGIDKYMDIIKGIDTRMNQK